MRRLVRESCDFLVSIPMAGHVDSLNVSVAAGVVLFEAARQRRVRVRRPELQFRRSARTEVRAYVRSFLSNHPSAARSGEVTCQLFEL